MMDNKRRKPNAKQRAKAEAEELRFFFMAAIQLHFLKEAEIRTRTLNVLLNLADGNVNQAALRQAHTMALSRLKNENEIDASDVKDSTFLSIFPLAHMSEEDFHANGQ